MPKESIAEMQKELRALADTKKAKDLARFFKTGKGHYAEGDVFLGVMVPKTRKLVKKFSSESLPNVLKVLQSPYHEERLLALLILVEKFTKGSAAERKKIYDSYLLNTKYVNNWDLVDQTASLIVGGYLENRSKKPILDLAHSKNLWEKRIAMIAPFAYITKGQSELALHIAEQLLFDEHDLIQKAVGWMLREVGKRCALVEEEAFLKKYASSMPRTTLRYAIERFDEQKRKKYMEMKKVSEYNNKIISKK